MNWKEIINYGTFAEFVLVLDHIGRGTVESSVIWSSTGMVEYSSELEL